MFVRACDTDFSRALSVQIFALRAGDAVIARSALFENGAVDENCCLIQLVPVQALPANASVELQVVSVKSSALHDAKVEQNSLPCLDNNRVRVYSEAICHQASSSVFEVVSISVDGDVSQESIDHATRQVRSLVEKRMPCISRISCLRAHFDSVARVWEALDGQENRRILPCMLLCCDWLPRENSIMQLQVTALEFGRNVED